MAEQVHEYIESNSQIPPVPIIQFVNGKLSQSTETIPVQLFENKRDPSDRFAATKIGDNEYAGRNINSSKGKTVNQPCKYYVAVRRKSSNKVIFLDAEKYELQRVCPETRVFEDIAEVTTFREKTDQLTKAFGSSKRQRAMRSRHLNRIEGDALDNAMGVTLMDTSNLDSSIQSKTIVAKEATSVELLPPYNKDASRPQDVYDIKDIISPIEFEAIKSTNAEEIAKATNEDLEQWKKQQKFGYFIQNHIPMLPVDMEKRMNAATKLKYLDLMIKMYQANVAQLKKKVTFSDVPACVKTKLLAEFTMSSHDANGVPRLLRPMRLKDKLLLYILILAMSIDDYRLQLAELIMDLKLSKKSLTNYLRAIGAQVKKSTETFAGAKMESHIAVIPIPLTFPDVKEIKRRKFQ